MERANMSFEDQWSEAFSDAEITPPEHVWASIDGVLANQAASNSKKRVIFFQWVAAASVGLALLLGGALWYQASDDTLMLSDSTNMTESPVVADNQNNPAQIESSQTENSNSTETEQSSKSITNAEKRSLHVNKSSKSTISTDQRPIKESQILALQESKNDELIKDKKRRNEDNIYVAVVEEEDEIEEVEKNHQLAFSQEIEEENQSTLLPEFQNSEFDFVTNIDIDPTIHVSPSVPEQLWLVPDLSALGDSSPKGFDLWAGLSFGSGSFNPGTEGSGSGDQFDAQNLTEADGSLSLVSSAKEIPLDAQYATGRSFSAGLDVGGRLSNKILLSSGLYYNTVSPGSTTGIIINEASTNRSFALSNDNAGSASLDEGLQNGEFTVSSGSNSFNNTLQYLSIPLKAGYVVLDRKLNVTVNSGISTNVLIGSDLNSADGGLQNFAGSDSQNNTFSSTYFDFLSSIQFGYNIKEKYLLSLEPNYRRAINNFTKSDSSVEGKPTNFGISLGIKYNF